MTREERAKCAVEMDEVIDAVNKHLGSSIGLLDPRCLQIAITKLQEVCMWYEEALNIDNRKNVVRPP